MAVRIRMKKLGRKHQPYFRICAMDQRTPRGGRVLEELGSYDPMLRDTDARAVLNGERINYWLSVGAQPSDKVKVLIKKYGADGTHLEQQKAALELLARPKDIPDPGKPASLPKKEEPKAEEAPAAPAEEAAAPAPEAPAAEAPTEEAPAAEAAAEPASEEAVAEAPAEAAPAEEAAAKAPAEEPAAEEAPAAEAAPKSAEESTEEKKSE